GRRLTFALGAGLGAHLVAVVWTTITAPSLETWSAELATRVHAELTRQEVIELPKPPPPKPEPPKPPPPPSPSQPVAHARRAPTAPRPSAPAQAGKILTAAPTAPLDL